MIQDFTSMSKSNQSKLYFPFIEIDLSSVPVFIDTVPLSCLSILNDSYNLD
jgi:hypothetical protein